MFIYINLLKINLSKTFATNVDRSPAKSNQFRPQAKKRLVKKHTHPRIPARSSFGRYNQQDKQEALAIFRKSVFQLRRKIGLFAAAEASTRRRFRPHFVSIFILFYSDTKARLMSGLIRNLICRMRVRGRVYFEKRGRGKGLRIGT